MGNKLGSVFTVNRSMNRHKHKVKYVSIKLPACGTAYPLDTFGCRKLPNYSAEYLRKHARKLHRILRDKVPGTLYSEIVKCIKAEEAGHRV